MSKCRAHSFLLLACLLVSGAVCAMPPRPPPVPPEELPEALRKAFSKGECVIIGKLIAGKGLDEGGGPVTIEVVQCFKGNLSGKVTVNWDFGYRYYGGGIGFRIGDLYFLILLKPASPQSSVWSIYDWGDTFYSADAIKHGWVKETGGRFEAAGVLKDLVDSDRQPRAPPNEKPDKVKTQEK